MGVPTPEVCYTSAITGRGDHEVRDGHVVALDKKKDYPEKLVTDYQSVLCNIPEEQGL
jgi:hypothetical protein